MKVSAKILPYTIGFCLGQLGLNRQDQFRVLDLSPHLCIESPTVSAPSQHPLSLQAPRFSKQTLTTKVGNPIHWKDTQRSMRLGIAFNSASNQLRARTLSIRFLSKPYGPFQTQDCVSILVQMVCLTGDSMAMMQEALECKIVWQMATCVKHSPLRQALQASLTSCSLSQVSTNLALQSLLPLK